MPAYTTAPALWTNSSAANFRAWGSEVSAKLLAMGLVKTSDTGQIDWTTVAAPGGVDTYMGYEIWRFADALQATAPVFMKIQFGSGSTSLNNPGMRFVFGSGSDGVGNLTGVLSSNLDVESTAAVVPSTAYWSGDTNRFAMCLSVTNSATAFWFGFERSVDSTGAVTSEAVLWCAKNTATPGSAYSQLAWDTATGDKLASENTVGALIPQSGTGITGTQISTYPIFHNKGVYMYPGYNFQAYVAASIAAGSAFSISYYGASHVYMGQNSSLVAPSFPTRAGSPAMSLMMRYE